MPRIRKALITAFGDESNISVVEAEIGSPKDDEIQIKVEYAPIGGSDINMRKGIYPFQRRAPLTPGYSVVGRVAAVGSARSAFVVNQRVVCLTIYEGQSELVNVPERFVVGVPENVDPKQAAALVLDWATAYQMLHRTAKVARGARIFVHGLSGGVGRGLLALAKLHGAEVYGTASATYHTELAKLGAHAFVYTDKNWIQKMQEIGGVDAVFDPLGFKSFDESESILRDKGILVAYGMNLASLTQRSRHSPVFEFLRLLSKNLKFWTGKRAAFYGISRGSKYYAADLKTLLGLVEQKQIDVQIKSVYRLEQIREAHKAWSGTSGPKNGMGTMLIDFT